MRTLHLSNSRHMAFGLGKQTVSSAIEKSSNSTALRFNIKSNYFFTINLDVNPITLDPDSKDLSPPPLCAVYALSARERYACPFWPSSVLCGMSLCHLETELSRGAGITGPLYLPRRENPPQSLKRPWQVVSISLCGCERERESTAFPKKTKAFLVKLFFLDPLDHNSTQIYINIIVKTFFVWKNYMVPLNDSVTI